MDFVATLPWGLQIIRNVEGGLYHEMADTSATKRQYWTTKYRLEAPVQMQKLLETAMIPETFNKIQTPVFSGYYYKNEAEQDPVVSVAAMRKMFTELGTPNALKHEQAFPNAGSPRNRLGLGYKTPSRSEGSYLRFSPTSIELCGQKQPRKIRSTSLHSAVPKTFTTLKC